RTGSVGKPPPPGPEMRRSRLPGAFRRFYNAGAALGGVAERSNASVLKTDDAARYPRVRIPPPPLPRPAAVLALVPSSAAASVPPVPEQPPRRVLVLLGE